LLEFGQAMKLPSAHSEIVQVVNANGYTAPEVLTGQPYNGFLADVWSMWVRFFGFHYFENISVFFRR